MDPEKLKGVADWPIPKTVKNVQEFLGFTNFYRRFIHKFSDITRPLHDLTRKDQVWSWGEKEQAAFDGLKRALLSAPILAFPDLNKPFQVEADSSNFATGAILSQRQDDGRMHPIAYLSKSLTEVERNYDIHDKEMLSIMRSLEEWRHFLEGAREQSEILSDHKNLEYFMTAKKLN